MRFTLLFLLVAAMSSGCASRPKEAASPFVGKTSESGNAGKAKETPKEPPGKPEIMPSNEISGKVMLVNDTLRYVVVDFGFGRLPQPDQRLHVYRKGAKVAEVKISGTPKVSNYAADIVTGNVQEGDEVRQ
jgi:hypothetical protein